MRILLAGYYGYGNLGDELLCETAKDILAPLAKIAVLDRAGRDPFKLLRNLKNCDCLLFAGGSLFQDTTGRGLTVAYYSAIALLAKLFRKKLFFVAQGLGPIQKPLNRWLVKAVMTRADYISVRNKESAAFLQALGLDVPVYNDLFFARQIKGAVSQKTSKKTSIVISFRPTRKHSGALHGIVRTLKNNINADLQFVSMHKGVDDQIMPKSISNRAEIFKLLNNADLAVGMRLHFLILAAKLGIPFIGIAYDPKVEGLCKRLGMPYISLEMISLLPEVIAEELPKCSIRRQHLRTAIAKEEAIAKLSVAELMQRLKDEL